MPGDYEHLKIQDVGMRSVYSGLSPYVNTRQEVDKAAGERDSVACHVTSSYRQGVTTDSESLFVCWLGLFFLYTISSNLRYIGCTRPQNMFEKKKRKKKKKKRTLQQSNTTHCLSFTT